MNKYVNTWKWPLIFETNHGILVIKTINQKKWCDGFYTLSCDNVGKEREDWTLKSKVKEILPWDILTMLENNASPPHPPPQKKIFVTGPVRKPRNKMLEATWSRRGCWHYGTVINSFLRPPGHCQLCFGTEHPSSCSSWNIHANRGRSFIISSQRICHNLTNLLGSFRFNWDQWVGSLPEYHVASRILLQGSWCLYLLHNT